MKHFIVATAGHVDHGKSALVRALTGTDPDRLPEEKARGITIDLGFAHLPLPGLDLGIVDVPGHEDFVKNMVAGVGSVDLVLFVVAADDGWMPQTEEHLQILIYLGVTRAVVALTKIDLMEDEAASVAQVRERLAGTPFEEAPIVPTSVIKDRGIDLLAEAIQSALADATPPRDVGKPRLPVDRVFALRGVGTIVTGTLIGGTLHRDQSVCVQPSGWPAHIRTLQNHGRESTHSLPGSRTALNLPEVGASGNSAVQRGEVVTLPGFGVSRRVWDVVLTRSARPIGAKFGPGTVRALQDGKNARIHFGSGHWTARVSLLNGGRLLPGERAIARLRFEQPAFAFAGDRFVLRDGAGRSTLAGGIILDPQPGSRRAFRRGAQRTFLERSAAAAADDLATVITAFLARNRASLNTELLRRWPFSATEIQTVVADLAAEGRVVLTGAYAADAPWWSALQTKVAAIVDAEHREHPERAGISISRLRAQLGGRLPTTDFFGEMIVALVDKGGFVRVGATIRRASHRPTLPTHLQQSGERLRVALAAKPFEPPSRRQLAPDGPSRQALKFLFETGEALEFGDEIVLLEESYRRMKTIILRTLRSAGPSTTSDLRQVLGTTRRVLIPVLERLDAEGSTRRTGDRRTLP